MVVSLCNFKNNNRRVHQFKTTPERFASKDESLDVFNTVKHYMDWMKETLPQSACVSLVDFPEILSISGFKAAQIQWTVATQV